MIRGVLAILVASVPALSLTASVVIYPTFSVPTSAGHSLLVNAPESDRLICVGDTGRVQWQRTFKGLVTFGELDAESFIVQAGRRVMRVESETGRSSTIATLPRGERVVMNVDSLAAWTVSIDWTRPAFVFRDRRSLRPLWRNDRIQSVEALNDRSVFAVTSTAHRGRDDTYTTTDAALVCLDRASGRQLWTYRLKDSSGHSVRAAVSNGRVAVLDGIPSSLVLLDANTGDRLVTPANAGAPLDARWTAAGDLQLLHASSGDADDVLTTHSMPDGKVKASTPLPGRENLYFFVDGATIVTSGIYSVAAFDSVSGTRLWEIDHQLVVGRLRGGRLFASRSDHARNMAVLERIDLRTGEEITLYEELLPPEKPPTAAERRADEKAAKKMLREQRDRARREERDRMTIGDEICLRYDKSGMLDVREYLLLRRDGTLEYVEADTDFTPVRMLGTWRKYGDVYEIAGTPLARDITAGRLHVSVGVRANLAVLPELRDVVQAVEQVHAGTSVLSADELNSLTRIQRGCPPEALSYCNAEGNLLLSVGEEFSYPPQPIDVSELTLLRQAIETYLQDLEHAGTLRFRLRPHRSMWYAEWIDEHSYWRHSTADAERQIDTAIEQAAYGSDDSQPALFRLDRCTDVIGALQSLEPITTVGSAPLSAECVSTQYSAQH